MISNNNMIITGEKESFVVRVLVKKVQEAGINCEFVPCTVTAINEKLDTTPLIALYVDENSRPGDDVLHFLTDSIDEKGGQLMLISEQVDQEFVFEYIPEKLFYKCFTRPVDNDEFTGCVKDYFKKVEEGGFKKSLLVVDDDPQYLSLIREWLKDAYKVSMVTSGLQAIKWLGKNKVDLILLDYEMPVTSGAQVLEMLRSDPDTSSIPVMFLTGKGDKQSVMAVVSLKPEGYFLKNIHKEELLEKLDEYFLLHGKH